MIFDDPRAVRALTEKELKRVLTDSESEIVEWPIGGFTFALSRRYLAIVRTGAMGGDMREVHGGCLYGNDISFLLARREIKMLPQNVTVTKKWT